MNDDKIRISPDALIAMIVTEAQDRELARMPSLEEMNEHLARDTVTQGHPVRS